MNIRYLFAVLLLGLISAPAVAQLSINEIMASNSTVIADNEGEFDDWIEIYNAGNVSVNLAGLYLSDDPDNLTKWQIPNTSSAQTTINANGYLIIWLDNDSEQGAHHVEFKLSAGGEHIALVDTDGTTVLDSLSFGEQTTDISLGRQTDGVGSFAFLNPTPNAMNDGSVVAEMSDTPSFSLETGFYSGSVTVGLSASGGAEIRYETGGSVPTANSTLYSSPISLDTSTVIRAIAIESGKQASDVVTNTYLFEDQHTIPVVSFVMEPDSLFDFDKGMYVIGDSSETNGQYPFFGANFWEDFQYPLHIEYMNEFGNPEFEFMAEAEIGGNFSRGFLKKSFIINNNDRFGLDRLEYPLFPENDYNEYDGFSLRAGAEERSRLLNELLRVINIEWNHKNAMQAYKPAILYINGEYWGIYNIYERKNDDFVESRYGFNDIDMIKDFDQVTDGDAMAYNELISNFQDETLSGEAFFNYAESVIDFDSFTDHWVYQVYTSHGDPNNVRYWRPRQEDGKWHYISYDFDWWRNLGDEPAEYFSSLKKFLSANIGGYNIFGRMMKNEQYRKIFLTRFADLLNTSFEPDYMMGLIDSIDTAINPEMPRDIARWTDGWYDIGGPTNYDMEYIRDITEDYVVDIRDYLYAEFNDTLGTDTVSVTLLSSSNGAVQLNSISPDISSSTWSGIYFQGTDAKFKAKPEVGYQISAWVVNDETQPASQSLTIPLSENPVTVEAQFSEITEVLVINEINYNSSDEFGTGDWVEIFNTMDSDVDVSGWIFKDDVDSNAFVVPENTVLKAQGYLVIADDTTKLKTVNSDARNYVGDFAFNLSGSGEELRLFNADGGLVDVVTYSDSNPWPIEADGDGPTLELTDSNADNTIAASWMASTRLGGTPGWANGTMPVSNEIEGKDTPDSFVLKQNYPNPFNPSTNITFVLPKSAKVQLTVYNMLGQKVETLVDGNLTSGSHTVRFEASNLSSGIYIYQLRTPTTSLTQRMVLVK
ncbi:MAG: lamin tail domain-containing protein [Balneola sp.]